MSIILKDQTLFLNPRSRICPRETSFESCNNYTPCIKRSKVYFIMKCCNYLISLCIKYFQYKKDSKEDVKTDEDSKEDNDQADSGEKDDKDSGEEAKNDDDDDDNDDNDDKDDDDKNDSGETASKEQDAAGKFQNWRLIAVAID